MEHPLHIASASFHSAFAVRGVESSATRRRAASKRDEILRVLILNKYSTISSTEES